MKLAICILVGIGALDAADSTRLSLHIVGESGSHVSKPGIITIEMSPIDRKRGTPFTTTARGKNPVIFLVPEGTYLLRIEESGFYPYQGVHRVAGRHQTITVGLIVGGVGEPWHRVSGSIPQGCEACTVVLYGIFNHFRFECEVDDGRFEIKDIPPGNYGVWLVDHYCPN